MRGLLAADAEIARRADQRSIEVVHPDAVRDNAGGQRVVRRHNGLGKFQPAGAVREWPAVVARDQAHELARHSLPGRF